jgi:hypothetical protein
VFFLYLFIRQWINTTKKSDIGFKTDELLQEPQTCGFELVMAASGLAQAKINQTYSVSVFITEHSRQRHRAARFCLSGALLVIGM